MRMKVFLIVSWQMSQDPIEEEPTKIGLRGEVKKLSNRDINANLPAKVVSRPTSLGLMKENTLDMVENHQDIYHEIAPENIQLEEIRPSYDENSDDDENKKHVYDNAAYDSDSNEESENEAAEKDATTC